MASGPSQRDLEAAVAQAAAGKRVVLRRGGRRLAIVPAEDLARLAAWDAAEDEDLVAAAEAALAESEAKGEAPVPWDEARRRLGV